MIVIPFNNEKYLLVGEILIHQIKEGEIQKWKNIYKADLVLKKQDENKYLFLQLIEEAKFELVD